MKIINYVSVVAVPSIIFIIICWAVFEKKKVFDLFIDGAKEGLEITLKIFPTLIGIFFSIGLLRSSGIINFIVDVLQPIMKIVKFPSEIIPLAILRPISGSAAIGIATDIMKEHGVDSLIGKIASVIMGSTETTLYTIAVYTSCVRIRKNRGIIFAALAADVAGIVAAVAFCRIMS